MTPLQKIALRLSEVRSRLNKIASLEGDALTDEIRTEAASLQTEFADLEVRHRAAIVASSDDSEPRDVDPAAVTVDAEHRARLELRSKCHASAYLVAALTGKPLQGAELELLQQVGGDGIPLEVFEPRAEDRATITPAPGTTGINLAPVAPALFAPSLAPRLGIDMPGVESGGYGVSRIGTSVTAGAVAKGAQVPETAGALTVSTTTAHRVGASLSLAIEDIANVGISNFESSLRENISLVLSAALDDQLVNGGGDGSNISGLLKLLDDPAAPAANAETWERYAGVQASAVDGIWASQLSHVSLICNPATYIHAAATFRGTDAELSAAAYLEARGAEFSTNARMPDAAANIAVGIIARRGRPGLRTAACPTWGSVSIDDIFSGARRGERSFTVSILIGDVLLVQPGAYKQVGFRLAA